MNLTELNDYIEHLLGILLYKSPARPGTFSMDNQPLSQNVEDRSKMDWEQYLDQLDREEQDRVGRVMKNDILRRPQNNSDAFENKYNTKDFAVPGLNDSVRKMYGDMFGGRDLIRDMLTEHYRRGNTGNE